MDDVTAFKKGIKRDTLVCPILEDDSKFRAWNRQLVIQACAQDVDVVLDSKCQPSTPEQKALFVEQEKFMMSVFDATSQSTKGKQLVRPHYNKNDAQKLCVKHSHHCAIISWKC